MIFDSAMTKPKKSGYVVSPCATSLVDATVPTNGTAHQASKCSFELLELDATTSAFDVGFDFVAIFFRSAFFKRCRASFDHLLGFH